MRDFLAALAECSVSMSALGLALAALTPLLSKRYAAKWIYDAWLVVAAGLIVPFRFHFRTVVIRAEAVPSPLRQALSGGAGNAAVPAAAGSGGAPAVPWVPIFFALWLAGAAAFLICHGVRHARFLRTVKRWGERADDPRMLETLESMKSDMRIAAPVELRICPCVSSPMMIGFRKPAILLPRSDFSEDELPYIFRHELAHFKRKDLWSKGLMILAAAIHWFNPAVCWMAKAAALQCEIACDAEVVSGIGPEGRRRYGETILKAIQRGPGRRTAFSTNFYGGKTGMKKRIFSILDTRKKRAAVLLLCLILLGTLGTGTALAVSKSGQSGPSASRTDTLEPIRTIAGKWAEAVKKRDGRAQYDLLSPECRAAVYDEYSSNHWSTGVSSPWVESYEISAGKNGATVTYRYATSTGFAGTYEQILSFAERDGKLYIDSFSDPKEIS